MIYTIKNNILNACIFLTCILMYVYISIQINTNNIRQIIGSNINVYTIYTLIFAFAVIDIIIYLFYRKNSVLLTCILLEFSVGYFVSVLTVTNPGILYFPVLILLILTIYDDTKIFNIYLGGFILCTLSYVISALAHSIKDKSIINNISYNFWLHLFISLMISVVIALVFYSDYKLSNILGDSSINNKLAVAGNVALDINNINNNTINTEVAKTTTYDDTYISSTNSDCTDDLDVEVTEDNITQDLAAYTITKNNSKSVYSLSADLKRNINELSAINNTTYNHTKDIKKSLLNAKSLYNDLLRTSFNINNAKNNFKSNIDDAHIQADLLKNLLYELDNMSAITTHLATKVKLEKSYGEINIEVLNYIIKEFSSYADMIRKSVIKMRTIYSNFDRSYENAHSEIKAMNKTLISERTITKELLDNIDKLNNMFNLILTDTSKLESILDKSHITARHLVADSSELYNAASSLGKFSYSVSKLKN